MLPLLFIKLQEKPINFSHEIFNGIEFYLHLGSSKLIFQEVLNFGEQIAISSTTQCLLLYSVKRTNLSLEEFEDRMKNQFLFSDRNIFSVIFCVDARMVDFYEHFCFVF